MKKLLIWVLILTLLTGCSPKVPPSEPTSTPSASTVSESTAPPPPPAEPPSLLDGAAALKDNLVKLQSEALNSLSNITSIAIFKDCLMVGSMIAMPKFDDSDTGYDYQITLVDLESGSLEKQVRFPFAPYPAVQICDEVIAVSDAQSGQIRLFDRDLQEQAYQLSADFSYLYLNTAAEAVYAFTNDCQFQVINLETMESSPLYVDCTLLSPDNRIGNTLSFSYYREDTLYYDALDLNTGIFSSCPYQASCNRSCCVDGLWLSELLVAPDVFFFGRKDSETAGFLSRLSSYLLIEGPYPLMDQVFTEQPFVSMYFYREDGTLGAECTFPYDSGYYQQPVWCDLYNGYFMIEPSHTGSTGILFLDVSQPASGADLDILPLDAIEPAEGTAVARFLYDRAAALSDQYSISVCIADQCATDFQYFSAETLTDYWTVNNGLDTLETALAAYPDGFFEQLLYGDFILTEINLTGSLHPSDLPDDATGFTSFVAYVINDLPQHTMVLDITQPNLEQTIYHEFSHIIDDKLMFDFWNGDSLFSEEQWFTFNPPAFDYTWDVYYVPDSYYNDGFDGYFIDTYARTYPTEDRARILEYAMSDQSWYFEGDSQQPLRDKLAYYSACIRSSFDTAGWPAETVWELPLHGYRYQP